MEIVVTVKGKLGELTQEISGDITVRIEDETVIVTDHQKVNHHKASLVYIDH